MGYRLANLSTRLLKACTPCVSSARARRQAGTFAAIVITALFFTGTPAAAADKPRVASINVCTDQLLLALADPGQIVGLSPASRDVARSWAATDASRHPRLSGQAEDVLILKPDLVVAGLFSRRATRELLKAKNIPVAEFDVATSLQHARDQIGRMGELTRQPERAAAHIARLDQAVERTRAAAARRSFTVLPLSRRGWVSGSDSLVNALLVAAGLSNAAGRIGLKAGGFASLETIVSAHPDLILVADDSPFAEDQGRAFLLHPALQQLYPPDKRLVIPERLTVCGGPMLAEALDRLTAEIARASK
jgi:iron complex transport system substrate-binding protein